ncbi:hypothetical protein Q8A67_011883 [Cirrhinus molitorella]|uniref:Uncharacterized protein n=1 Tax=Cirrhinus molitorella TaxID=172907 RepID=A0AA88PLC7_9TELE|nr:hypothetical protein Q8A67_011883 [Cirrhinus molitorella]
MNHRVQAGAGGLLHSVCVQHELYKNAARQSLGTFNINSFTSCVKRDFKGTFGLFKDTPEEKWILAIAPSLELATVVPPASALIASVQAARRAAVPAAPLVAASVPPAACVRATPAAPAAVNEEVNVMGFSTTV